MAAQKLTRDFTNTASSPAADDYLPIDGPTNNTRKLLATYYSSVAELAESTGIKLTSPTVYFGGSTDYVEVPDDPMLSSTDGTDDLPFSVSAWIKPSTVASFIVVCKYGTSAANREWSFNINGNSDLSFIVQDTSSNFKGQVSTVDLSAYDEKWVHVCATYGGAGPNSTSPFTSASDEITLYVNGDPVAMTMSDSGTYTGMSDTGQAVWIGRLSTTYAHGHMREVTIFNRELSATEVKADLGFADEWGGPTATSGVLEIGRRYRIYDFQAGDDFTNVGASSNAFGVEFIASGTTPTTWANSSVIQDIGILVSYKGENFDEADDRWVEASTNDLDGTNNGATLVAAQKHVKASSLDLSGMPTTTTWASDAYLPMDSLTEGDRRILASDLAGANIRTAVGDDTATTSDNTILCDASGGAMTLDLPTAASASGRKLWLKKIDVSANAVTIDGNGAETIDGATTQSLAAQWDSVTIQSDGTSWYIL